MPAKSPLRTSRRILPRSSKIVGGNPWPSLLSSLRSVLRAPKSGLPSRPSVSLCIANALSATSNSPWVLQRIPTPSNKPTFIASASDLQIGHVTFSAMQYLPYATALASFVGPLRHTLLKSDFGQSEKLRQRDDTDGLPSTTDSHVC
jgi:hypothetical protein